ncbi:MAG TPA: hypothetical protein VMZ30_03980 [Pyrinomonadaceae bacterium]|nr:hypothetical protein [Pyrinomonadaceae bacterium]
MKRFFLSRSGDTADVERLRAAECGDSVPGANGLNNELNIAVRVERLEAT